MIDHRLYPDETSHRANMLKSWENTALLGLVLELETRRASCAGVALVEAHAKGLSMKPKNINRRQARLYEPKSTQHVARPYKPVAGWVNVISEDIKAVAYSMPLWPLAYLLHH